MAQVYLYISIYDSRHQQFTQHNKIWKKNKNRHDQRIGH